MSFSRWLAPLLMTLLLPGCATIMEGTSQTVYVLTRPAGAACTVDRAGAHVGDVVATPGSLRLAKGKNSLDIRCNKPGYQPASLLQKAKVARQTAGNLILFGGAIGVVTDAASGARYVYPPYVTLDLAPMPGSPPAPEAWDFRCPVAGTTVVRSDGRQIVYEGAEASDRDLCLYRENGAQRRSYFGLWPAGTATAQDARTQLRVLLRYPSDQTVQFDDSSFAGVWRERWRLGRVEALTIDGKTVETLKITRRRAGLIGDNTLVVTTFWLDRGTGAVVKQIDTTIRGPAGGDTGWQAKALTITPS